MNIFALMYKAFEQYLKSNTTLKNKILFLAISGGVDSMVLSHLLTHFNIPHTLLHCNFQLRGQESEEDEQFIIQYAKANQLPFETIKFDTKTYSQTNKLNTQEAARELRHNWFKSFLKTDQSYLLTAHHLDDSIETFFINLLRGTGLKGLTGISTNKNNIIRPLLGFKKSEIIDFANQNNIQFREDKSNASDNYLRNKLRHHIIPNLKELTGNFEGKMSTLFEDLSASSQFIDATFLDLKNQIKSNQRLNIEVLNTIPESLWHQLFSDFGLSRKHNSELIKLVYGNSGAIMTFNSYRFLKDRHQIIISNNTKPKTNSKLSISKNDSIVKLGQSELKISTIPYSSTLDFKPNIAYLNADKLVFPLEIRTWQQGDKIQPLGMQGSKLISDVLTDKKINQFDKENQYVITSNQNIIWLVDLMISNAFAIDDKTKSILKIEHIKY